MRGIELVGHSGFCGSVALLLTPDPHPMSRSLHRRDFIKHSALVAAGLLTGCTTAPKPGAKRPAAGSRLTVGLVGFGTIAHSTTPNFLADERLQVVAVADPVNELGNYGYGGEKSGGRQVGRRIVEAHYAEQASGSYTGCRAYEDFREMFDREDLDAVVVSAPDHWHCAIAVLAARRGLHVYGQKPLSLTVGEGRRMAREVAANAIVWQTGSQQRSSQYFRTACEFVRNGRLGRIASIKVGLPGGHTNWSKLADRTQPETPPAGVNYDLWLGPAPERPYVPALFQLNWRHNYDFSGGMITDWGAHHLDIVQWALGMDASGPSRIEIRGVTQPDAAALYNTSTDFDFDVIYPGGVRVNVSNKHPNGILFEGEDGKTLFVNRDSLVTTPAELRRERIRDGEIRLYESRLHERNFVDAIFNRTDTITPIEVGHRSITVPHLANIAIRLGRSALDWDPAAEAFVGDERANAMLQRPMRKGYAV